MSDWAAVLPATAYQRVFDDMVIHDGQGQSLVLLDVAETVVVTRQQVLKTLRMSVADCSKRILKFKRRIVSTFNF